MPGLAKTLLEIEVPWEAQPLNLFATHLGSRHDKPQPAQEVPLILDVLRPLRGRPHLLVGDFNAVLYGDPVGTPPAGVQWRVDPHDPTTGAAIGFVVDAGYLDCYRAVHSQALGYTYKSEHPWLRLDYVFASPEMAARLKGCDLVAGEGMEQ